MQRAKIHGIGRIIDGCTVMICLSVCAVLLFEKTPEMVLVFWGASAIMSMLSLWFDTTGKMLQWIAVEYPKQLRVLSLVAALQARKM